MTVEVSDEGGYWATRDEKKPRSVLECHDGLMTAVAGLMKDAADDSGKGHAIEAPIFARKDFERLEAENRRQFARHFS